MFDEAIVGATVTIHLIGVIARLLAHDDTVATNSEAITCWCASKSRLDLTRFRAPIPISNIVVVTLFA